MADQLALIKRVMRTQTNDVRHSSGYAQTQNREGFGSASAESFAQRRRVEEQRKFVRGYHNSKIMGGALMSGPKAKAFTPPAPKSFGAAPNVPKK